MENDMKDIMEILIAGGDMRQLFCAERLADKYGVSVIGFDPDLIPEGLSPAAGSKRFGCIVLPMPPLDENGLVNAPCYSGSLGIEELAEKLAPGGLILAGKADTRLAEAFTGSDIITYMDREDLQLRNAVPTAEGAVQLALEELPVTLSGLPVLIVGMGRIGIALAEILKGFGAEVTAAVRSRSSAAKAHLHGVKYTYIEGFSDRYALVFNTAPEMVFDRTMLEKSGRDTLFIDLASRPGGIDFEAAAELGRKAVWALGIPGKTAPVTAGEIVADTIAGILAERGAGDE